MSAIALSLVLSFTLLAIPPTPQNAKSPKAKAVVKGAVMVDSGALAPGVRVSFRRGRSVTAVTTSKDGTYEVRLAPGSYRVSTENVVFCPIRRSGFELPASVRVELNLHILVCGIMDYMRAGKSGKFESEFETRWPPHNYDSFPVHRTKSFARNLVVRYFDRKATADVIQYRTGSVPRYTPVRVVVTYNVITVVADHANLNTKTMQLCAQGNLTVEDGQHTTHPPAVSLQFEHGQAVLQEYTSCSNTPAGGRPSQP